MSDQRKFQCSACGYEWEVPHGIGGLGKEMVCPKSGSNNIHRVDIGGRGRGPGGRGGRRRP